MIQTLGRAKHPVWVIGDVPSYQDLKVKRVFSKGTGAVLTELLEGVGHDLEKIHYRYASNRRPKDGKLDSWLCTKTQGVSRGWPKLGDHYIDPEAKAEAEQLLADIEKHKPKLVYLLGDFAMLAAIGQKSTAAWRGSMVAVGETLFIPSFAIGLVIKNYDWTFFLKQDLARGAKYLAGKLPPKAAEHFTIRPTYEAVTARLNDLLNRAETGALPLGVDIEGRSVITCLGIAWSNEDALCIPFHSNSAGNEGSYWTTQEEINIVRLLEALFTHERVECHGQNFNYDRQHICKLWGFLPRLGMDTMQAWHVCFPILPKALHTICSFMSPWYLYWKDEGKGHNPESTVKAEDEYWVYNCRDCVRTFELVPLLQELVDDCSKRDQYEEQRALNKPSLRMMLSGFRQHAKTREQFVVELMASLAEYEAYFQRMTPALLGDNQLTKTKKASPWYRSPAQQVKLFYEIWGLPVQKNKKTKRPTCDDTALAALITKEPLLSPVLQRLQEYRSAGVFLATFCLAPLDWDRRFRCSYGIGMTSTFRFTSSKDAFGYGGNLQNIPSGDG